MKRVAFTSVLLFALALLLGCGTKSNTPASKLTISPTTASVATGGTVQFSATSTETSSPLVTWSINDVGTGNMTVGTINYSGLYIAPATVPTPAKVTITATLLSDSTQKASAEVTITAGTPVAISITPTETTVPASQTQRFTATVSNTANTTVIWKVEDVTGGDSVHGTIDQYGMFYAPATPPTPNTVTVKAVSQADSNKTATATVTITPFTYISVTPAVVPALSAGAQQQFTARLNGQPVDVTWSLHCGSEVVGACGAIDAAGLYTAPLSPPPGGDVSVTASSADPLINSGGAVVTIQFSNASLTGKYALSFSGKNGTGAYTAIGSISFDGSAGVTGGELDISHGGMSHVAVTGGTYNIGTDGRGAATINTGAGALNWRIVLSDHAQAYVIPSNTSGAIGSGTLDFQHEDAFTSASITGGYALSVAGPNANNAATLAMAGALTADGAGHISAGVLDVNNNGTLHEAMPLSETAYTAPSASGRGALTVTSTFGTQNFVYYVVDADRIKVLDADGIGTLTRQPAGPFTTQSFDGSYAFVLAGSAGGHPRALGGVFQLDGSGNVSSGTMDINDNGNLSSGTMSGTYAVTDSTLGRTTVAVTVNSATRHYVVYPNVDGANVLGADANELSSGLALAQSDTSYTDGSIAGTFALTLAGADLTANPGEEAVLGRISPNGGAAITGVLDINDNVVTSWATALSGATYDVATSGRGTGSLPTGFAPFSTAHFNIYVVDGSRALWLEADSNRVLYGIMRQQY